MADSDGFESADEDAIPEAGDELEQKPVLAEVEIQGNAEIVEQTVGEVEPEVKSPMEPEPTEAAIAASEQTDNVADDAREEAANDDWGWGGWSNWAASSVTSVAQMASKTTQGISGALETFEASLGLPTPEELAKEMKESEMKEESEEAPKQETSEAADSGKEEVKSEPGPDQPGYYPGAGLWSGLSSFSATGSKLLTSGLNTLEMVSNQAYEALNDQTADKTQTKRSRVKDSSKGANLMAVLQEAKNKYETQEKVSADTMRTMAYLFDEKQGLSQLEALDMLSKECVHKMKDVPADNNTLFLYIETSLELKSGDSEIIIEHLGAAVTDCLKTLKIDLPITKLNQCRYEIAQQLTEMDMASMDETAKPSDTKRVAVLDNSLNSVASFAARSVELFKKIAEMSLLKSSLEVDMKTQADTIKFLNEVLCCEIDNIREQFEQKTAQKEDVDVLFVEASNAVSYLQETLYFFVPILKWVVVKTSTR